MGNGITSSVKPYGIFDVDSLDSIVAPHLMSGFKWGSGTLSDGVDLTYSFLGDNSSYIFGYGSGEQGNRFSLNGQQKTAAANALDAFSDVADLDFTVVTESATLAGDIRFANTSHTDVETAWAYYPDSEPEGGDIWFGNQNGGYLTPTPGNHDYHGFLHELGHALGLKHPHDAGPTGPSSRDSLKFSVMSYRDHVGDALDGYESGVLPTTLMVDDIIAIQTIYGENFAIHSGNTVHTYGATEKVFETIWDGSGVDRIDASNQSQAAIISLVAGTYSSIGASFSNGSTMVRDCLGIAYNCDIEHATGSAYNDTLIGNSLGNVLNGGGGADSMSGGLGNDTYVYTSGDSITEAANAGTDTVQSGSSYMLSANVERLTLTGSAVYGTGNTLANIITGNGADNVLNGSTGVDTLIGGMGDDTYVTGDGDSIVETGVAGSGIDTVQSGISHTLANNIERLTLIGSAMYGTGNHLGNLIFGNASNNVLNGSTGNDTLSAGNGNDTFRFTTALSATTNVDTLLDFVAANDTIQIDNAIFTKLTATGWLSAVNFKANLTATAGDSSDHILYETDTGALYYDVDGTGSAAKIKFAVVGTSVHPTLTAADFYVM